MKKKKRLKVILNTLYILTLILILLILIDLKVWKYLDKKEIVEISLQDKCSILFGNVLHTIKDESSCENSCRAECITREMKFYNSKFILSSESCNTCNCQCK